jgi:predicted CXXCH cytochrome family protein
MVHRMSWRAAAVAAALSWLGRGAAAEPVAAGTTATARQAVEVPLLDAAHATNPHDFHGKPLCQRCHLPGQEGITGDPVALCTQCHDPAFMKHPYGIPARTVPPALPLEAGLRIVCHTCHDPHDVKKRRGGLRLDYGPLCAQCHAPHGQKQHPAEPPKAH